MSEKFGPADDGTNAPVSASTLGTAKARKVGNKKITRKLVSLSAAAILAVYSVGYFNTQSAAAQIAAQSSLVVPCYAKRARSSERHGRPSGYGNLDGEPVQGWYLRRFGY